MMHGQKNIKEQICFTRLQTYYTTTN